MILFYIKSDQNTHKIIQNGHKCYTKSSEMSRNMHKITHILCDISHMQYIWHYDGQYDMLHDTFHVKHYIELSLIK